MIPKLSTVIAPMMKKDVSLKSYFLKYTIIAKEKIDKMLNKCTPVESPMIYAMTSKYLSCPGLSASSFQRIINQTINVTSTVEEAYTSDSTALNQNVSLNVNAVAPTKAEPNTVTASPTEEYTLPLKFSITCTIIK